MMLNINYIKQYNIRENTAILKDLDSGTVTHYDFEMLKRSEIEILEGDK